MTVKKANKLICLSYNCLHLVRSLLADVTYALNTSFSALYATNHNLQVVFDGHLPLAVLTNSDSVFKAILRSTVTTEKRLMIDSNATREAYDRNEISNTD